MGFPGMLPSARSGQWFMDVLGAVPHGYGDIDELSLASVGDDVYLHNGYYVNNWQYPNSSIMDTHGRLWKISEYGGERLTATQTAFDYPRKDYMPGGQEYYSDDNYLYRKYPLGDSGKLGDTFFGGDYQGGVLDSDGTYLYYFQTATLKIYKIDPSDLTYEWIAGNGDKTPGTSTYGVNVDAYNGRDASFMVPYARTLQSNFLHINGWMYFFNVAVKGHQLYFWTLRRFKTSYPYTVETVWDYDFTPLDSYNLLNWFAPGLDAALIHPSDNGLPYGLRDDELNLPLCFWDTRYGGPSLAYDGDNIYFISTSNDETAKGAVDVIKSWSGTGLPKSLYYGWSFYGFKIGIGGILEVRQLITDYPNMPYSLREQLDWDQWCAFEQYPYGALDSDGDPLPGQYFDQTMPRMGGDLMYEGLQLVGGMTVTNDNKYLVLNNASASWLTGQGPSGYTPIGFELDSLLSLSSSAPVRHSRTEPIYKCLANGTYIDEGMESYFNLNNKKRSFAYRAGPVPLLNSPQPYTIKPYKNGVIMAGVVYTTTASDTDNSDYTGLMSVVSYLSPSGVNQNSSGSTANITVKFFEKELKGYHNINAGKRVPPPPVVEL